MPKILIEEETIRERVRALADLINADYADRTLDVVCLINGASIFCADLVRHIRLPMRHHSLGFSSYASPSPSGEVRVTLDVAEPLHGRDVLLVEGVVVSGRTPRYVTEMLRLRQPASIELCALAVKPKSLSVDLPVKYKAFEFGSQIVVGYGVGTGRERALPYLAESIQG